MREESLQQPGVNPSAQGTAQNDKEAANKEAKQTCRGVNSMLDEPFLNNNRGNLVFFLISTTFAFFRFFSVLLEQSKKRRAQNNPISHLCFNYSIHGAQCWSHCWTLLAKRESGWRVIGD